MKTAKRDKPEVVIAKLMHSVDRAIRAVEEVKQWRNVLELLAKEGDHE